jgi:hypothetical protein
VRGAKEGGKDGVHEAGSQRESIFIGEERDEGAVSYVTRVAEIYVRDRGEGVDG